MNSKDLQRRSKVFALAIIKFVEILPNNRVGWTFTDQIVRSATSVAANYRAVCRARSDKEFIAKMGIVIEEADETLFWLEMIDESAVLDNLKIKNTDLDTNSLSARNSKLEMEKLKKEANELVSIFVASVKTVKNKLK